MSLINITNRIGPKTEPCGTPQLRHLGRNRFAKPNRNRFQIFGFYAIDLSNLKPVSRNR